MTAEVKRTAAAVAGTARVSAHQAVSSPPIRFCEDCNQLICDQVVVYDKVQPAVSASGPASLLPQLGKKSTAARKGAMSPSPTRTGRASAATAHPASHPTTVSTGRPRLMDKCRNCGKLKEIANTAGFSLFA